MKRILLIEPDRVLAEIYIEALQREGFKVSWARGAQDGISLADKHRPDLVILELQLVEHSGIEFLYEFRSYSDWQNVQVIVNSQVPKEEFFSSQSVLEEELNVSTYLYKPRTTLRSLIYNINKLNYIRA